MDWDKLLTEEPKKKEEKKATPSFSSWDELLGVEKKTQQPIDTLEQKPQVKEIQKPAKFNSWEEVMGIYEKQPEWYKKGIEMPTEPLGMARKMLQPLSVATGVATGLVKSAQGDSDKGVFETVLETGFKGRPMGDVLEKPMNIIFGEVNTPLGAIGRATAQTYMDIFGDPNVWLGTGVGKAFIQDSQKIAGILKGAFGKDILSLKGTPLPKFTSMDDMARYGEKITWVEQQLKKSNIDQRVADAVKKQLTGAVYSEGLKEAGIAETFGKQAELKEWIPPKGRITTVERPKDLEGIMGAFNEQFAPVIKIAEKSPAAKKIFESARNAVINMNKDKESVQVLLDGVFKGMGREQRIQVGKLLNKKPTLDEMAALTDQQKVAYTQIRDLFGRFKKEIGDLGMAETGRWAIPDDAYFAHILVGDYTVKVGGKTNLVANFKEAQEFAEKALRENPNADILIEPRTFFNKEIAKAFPRKAYWSLIGRIKNATTMDKEEILNAMRGIAKIDKGKQKFFGNLKARTENLGGFLEDPKDVVKIYSDRFIRKKYLDPFNKESTELLKELPPGLRNYFDRYIKDVTGHYNPFDPKFQVGKATGFVRKLQANLKLGYRPSSALVNRMQVFQTAMPELGFKVYAKAIKRMRRIPGVKADTDLLKAVEETGLAKGTSKTYAGEYASRMGEMKWYHPLKMFISSERGNIEDSAAMALIYMEERGFSIHSKAAQNFARDFVGSTQYIYDISGLPQILRGNFGKTVGQFKPFSINYVYQATGLMKNALKSKENFLKATRFLAANLTVGGLKSVPYVARIGLLGAFFLNNPKLSSGILTNVTSLMGEDKAIDLSSQANVGEFFPTTLEQVLGVNAGDLLKLHKIGADRAWDYEIIQADIRNGRILAEIAQMSSPAAVNVFQGISGEIHADYGLGKKVIDMDLLQRGFKVAGFKSLEETQARSMETYIYDLNQKIKKQKSVFYDEYFKAIQQNDEFKQKAVTSFAVRNNLRVNPDSVKEYAKNFNLETYERLLKSKVVTKEAKLEIVKMMKNIQESRGINE